MSAHAAGEFVRWKKPEISVDESLAEELGRRFEIDLCEGLLRAAPGNLLALMVVGHLYTHCGRHRDALRIDRRLAELRPVDPIVRYNLACSYSHLDRLDDAFAALDTAIELGYRDFDFLEQDPDLENLRRDPRFEPFLDERRERRANDPGEGE